MNGKVREPTQRGVHSKAHMPALRWAKAMPCISREMSPLSRQFMNTQMLPMPIWHFTFPQVKWPGCSALAWSRYRQAGVVR